MILYYTKILDHQTLFPLHKYQFYIYLNPVMNSKPFHITVAVCDASELTGPAHAYV
jgi:hypothetical protein